MLISNEKIFGLLTAVNIPADPAGGGVRRHFAGVASRA